MLATVAYYVICVSWCGYHRIRGTACACLLITAENASVPSIEDYLHC